MGKSELNEISGSMSGVCDNVGAVTSGNGDVGSEAGQQGAASASAGIDFNDSDSEFNKVRRWRITLANDKKKRVYVYNTTLYGFDTH